MKQKPDYKQLSTADLCRIVADVLEVLNERVTDPKECEDITAVMLAKALTRGAEPYWMQDVRLAQRRIQTAREASREASEHSE